MPFGSVIDRDGIEPLIPEDVQREIIQGMPQDSTVLTLGRRLPNMSRAQQRMPVLASLPIAYFVNGDTGLKKTTQAAWANKYLNAEEVAVIVPVPDAVLDDSDYDIWSEIKPLLVEAVGVTVDAAILLGVNAPSSWPTNIKDGATAAGNNVSLASMADMYDATLGEGGTFGKVEEDGYSVTGSAAHTTVKAKLRGLRDLNGQPIFMQSMQQAGGYTLDGQPLVFAKTDALDADEALMFSGDWKQLVYSIRQDLTFRIFTEGVVQDAAGNIIYNLMQQDMVALRMVFRLAWQLPNPISRLQPVEANRYPFAVLEP